MADPTRCEGSNKTGYRVIPWRRGCWTCRQAFDPVQAPDGCIVVPEHDREREQAPVGEDSEHG